MVLGAFFRFCFSPMCSESFPLSFIRSPWSFGLSSACAPAVGCFAPLAYQLSWEHGRVFYLLQSELYLDS